MFYVSEGSGGWEGRLNVIPVAAIMVLWSVIGIHLGRGTQGGAVCFFFGFTAPLTEGQMYPAAFENEEMKGAHERLELSGKSSVFDLGLPLAGAQTIWSLISLERSRGGRGSSLNFIPAGVLVNKQIWNT